MYTITPNTSKRQLKRYLGTRSDLKRIQKRRKYLEKIATMHSGEPVFVEISGDTAYADISSKDSKHGYTDRIVINIPLEVPDQTVTDLEQDTWELLFHKSELYHELGHVLYSDWPSFEEILIDLEKPEDYFFKSIWNILEDSAIERRIINRFDVENDLEIKNANLLTGNCPERRITLHDAVLCECMEYKYPVGWTDMIRSRETYPALVKKRLDTFESDIIPILNERCPKIIAENDPVRRNERVFALFDEIMQYIDIGTHQTHHMYGDLMAELFEGMEESNDGTEGEKEEMEPDEVEKAEIPVDVDATQDYSDEIEEEEEIGDEDALQDSVESWHRAIETIYEEGADSNIRVSSDEDENYSAERRTKAKRLSKRISTDLGQRLRHERRSEKKSGQRTGRVDATSIHKTERAETKIFRRTAEPNEKDYCCMLLLDRSGSMSGDGSMEAAELAAGAFSYALEDIGVDIGILSVSGSDIYLEKSFVQSTEEAKNKLFSGFCSSGTPLSDSLCLARNRLEGQRGHPFVIVLTDGKPDHREKYRDELHKSDFPVLGLYISGSDDGYSDKHLNESSYFHHLEIRRQSEILTGIKNLTRRVIF